MRPDIDIVIPTVLPRRSAELAALLADVDAADADDAAAAADAAADVVDPKIVSM